MSSVAIVLATLERPSVRRVIREVCEQAPPSAEILVVDQSNEAEHVRTKAWCDARGDRRLRCVHRTERSLPAARNLGLRATRAPVVIFFDDDVRLHPGCISAHQARYRDAAVGGVAGRIVERRLTPNAWRTTNRVGLGGRVLTRLDGRDAMAIHTLKGANMSFRRVAIEAVGGFDDGFRGNAMLEDADASRRVRTVGWRLVYEPEAAVDHLHDPSGGVRTEPIDPLWWRFHNTARFVRRHRGWLGLAPFMATHVAIAMQRSVLTRDPRRMWGLSRALVAGWRSLPELSPAAPSAHVGR